MKKQCFFWWGHATEVFVEMNRDLTVDLVNPRSYHTYLDEDTIGSMKGLAKRCHRKLLELRVLMRWLLRLKHFLRH